VIKIVDGAFPDAAADKSEMVSVIVRLKTSEH
jgi:hypothetical protein